MDGVDGLDFSPGKVSALDPKGKFEEKPKEK